MGRSFAERKATLVFGRGALARELEARRRTREAFDGNLACSNARFFALRPTTQTIGRRLIKAAEFLANWRNWVDLFVDRFRWRERRPREPRFVPR